jgi:hypothetical protein
MSCPARLFPFRKPVNHRVPIPRWILSLPKDIDQVYTTYIGLQQHSESEEAVNAINQAINAIQKWLAEENGPAAFEPFIVLDDTSTKDLAVWVCYWSDTVKRTASLEKLSLSAIRSGLPVHDRPLVGIWKESFATKVSRLETNYSGLDYLPGLAKLPGASTIEHTLSAYWGAARDRIPDSGFDLFPRSSNSQHLNLAPTGIGQHLVGTNHANLVHIRSGQFWENCSQQEADSYEKKLEPTLRAGLQYLREHGDETGAMGVRYLRNSILPVKTHGCDQKETCGVGFFANLEDLENWAKTHRSHLKIYLGALAHYKAFGDMRRFRTWHEVSVIKEADATFEYINCTPQTGVMGYIPLHVKEEIVPDDGTCS